MKDVELVIEDIDREIIRQKMPHLSIIEINNLDKVEFPVLSSVQVMATVIVLYDIIAELEDRIAFLEDKLGVTSFDDWE